MSEQRRSIAVIGPGAIGGALVGALLDVDADPLVCARTGFADIVVTHPEGRVACKVRCVEKPEQLASLSVAAGDASAAVDLVILAVKAHQTSAASGWLGELTGPNTTVVVAQNGVEHAERVRPHVHPDAAVVPAVIWCPARRDGPGRIEVTGAARLTVPASGGADLLAEAFDGSFFEIRASSDWLSRAWDKLLINSALGGLGVLTGRSGAALCADPVIRDLLLQLMTEAVRVGRAEGATIVDDRPDQILHGMAASGVNHVSSIAVDRKAGLPTEWDARNQVIERLAERHGIDVPLNRWLTALIRMGEPE